MNEYQFDMSNFTIADAMRVRTNALMDDTYGVLLIANQFIPINILALPISELPIVLDCFVRAVAATQQPIPDPIDMLIRKALEH